MNRLITTIILDDSEESISVILSELSKGNFTLSYKVARTLLEFEKLLEEKEWDLIISNRDIDKIRSDKALKIYNSLKLDVPFIVISEMINKELLLNYYNLGANDFIVRTSIFRFLPVVDRELKNAENVKKVKQSLAILKHVDSMVIVCERDGSVSYASPSVEKMLGYKVEEVMGDNWWKVTYENEKEADRVRNAIRNYDFDDIKQDFSEISRRKIKTKSGEYKWIEWQVSKGINKTIISVGIDSTDRIRAEKELQKAKTYAEETLKIKNDFLANMSHEIRTPMNAVIGFTDLLLETELTEEQRLHLETMKTSGNILLSLINNILDLSKLESNKLEIENIPFNFSKTVTEVVNLMTLKAKEKNIDLELVLDKNIPKLLNGDPTRLSQILLNLIGNAVKFTHKGYVRVSVSSLKQTPEDVDLEIVVEDTGIGIVSNKINTVFGAFTQAKSDTSRIYGGTGLGLTIVKKLVNLLNGRIFVKSVFGKGSTFTIQMNFKIGTPKKTVAKPKTKEVAKRKALHLNILVVEDNKINQLLAKTRLERWECNVDMANNGIEAVKLVQKKPVYNIILMDIQMPVMDGFEATKIIKNDLSDEAAKIPIVAMTAHASKKEILRLKDAGMVDYIFKPFDVDDLYDKLIKYSLSH